MKPLRQSRYDVHSKKILDSSTESLVTCLPTYLPTYITNTVIGVRINQSNTLDWMVLSVCFVFARVSKTVEPLSPPAGPLRKFEMLRASLAVGVSTKSVVVVTVCMKLYVFRHVRYGTRTRIVRI